MSLARWIKGCTDPEAKDYTGRKGPGLQQLRDPSLEMNSNVHCMGRPEGPNSAKFS